MLNGGKQNKSSFQDADQAEENERISTKVIPQSRYNNMDLRLNQQNTDQVQIGQPNYNYPPAARPISDNFQPTSSLVQQQNIQVSNPSNQQNVKTDLYINFEMPQMQYQDSKSNLPKSLEPSQPNQHINYYHQDEENQLKNAQINQNQNYQQSAGYQYQQPYDTNPQMMMVNQNMNGNQNNLYNNNEQNQYNPNQYGSGYYNTNQNYQYPIQGMNPQMMNQPEYQQGFLNQNPYPNPNLYPPPPMMNQPVNPYPPNPIIIEQRNINIELKDIKQVPQTTSQSIKQPQQEQYVRKETRVKRKSTYVKRNTVSHAVATSTSNVVYLFADTPGYHSDPCCCQLLYMDDCMIKWMCDLFFHLIYLPFRFLNFIFKSIGSLCCKESCSQCVEGVEHCFYAPFRCCGDWSNQCWYSCTNFCCQGIDFIPATFSSLYTNCCQKCFLQTGQCVKNCCIFNLDCNCKCLPDCPDCTDICKNSDGHCCCLECCHDIGDCCFHLCTPQGCCEDMCKCCSQISCNCINSDCISDCCSCCVKVKEIDVGTETVKFLECCFCLFIKTIGDIIEGVLK